MTEEIVQGYRPGAIGRITELHAVYYHEHWGFDLFFESQVATRLSEFLNRYHDSHDGLWLALTQGRIIGSIVIDGIEASSEGAHLRWFIVAPEYQGRGVGRKLIGAAIQFCKRSGFRRVYLHTFAGLDAARHLYQEAGFTLRQEHEGQQWGRIVTEQLFVLDLGSAGRLAQTQYPMRAMPSIPSGDTIMEIRPFLESDQAAVAQLWREVFPDAPAWNIPEADIQRKLAVQRELFMVARVGSEVVGTAMAGYDGHRGWVYYVAVSPKYRRQRIGTALMERVEKELAQLGCPKINLQVRASNHQVVSFYTQLGYHVEERVSMGKRLGDETG